MKTVLHDGRETAYRITGEDGEGPTTLYVHGSGGNHQVWVHQYAPSGPSHPAVAVDLSGHGDSEDLETAPGSETLAAYAADVAAVATATDADVLVGNSLGGAVVLTTVLEEYYRPDGIVLAGTGAKLAVHESIRTMLREDFDGIVSMLHEDSLLFATADEDVNAASRETIRDTGQAVTRRDFLTCHEFDVRDELDRIDVPALAVVGSEDALTPPSYHEYLAEEIPDCELETIEGVGHLAMLERPARFNDVIASFTQRF